MRNATEEITTRNRMPELTEERAHRLRSGLRLVEVSVASGINMCRLSEIERHPDRARAGELERLKSAVDKIAAARGSEQ